MSSNSDFDQTVTHVAPNARNDRLHFFKYMRADTAKIVLCNNTLRWSKGSVLNDPLELQFDLRLDLDRDYILKEAVKRGLENNRSQNPTDDVRRMMSSIANLGQILRPKAFRLLLDDGLTRYLKQMNDRLPMVQQVSAKFSEHVKVLSLTS